MPLIVLKFGSSVLRSAADLPGAVHEIYRYYRAGERVLAVVSAIGLATDELLATANEISRDPDSWATAELLAAGERTSAALLGIALDRAGIRARVVDPREVAFVCEGNPMDAKPVAVDVERLQCLLSDYTVLVMAGFFATELGGRTQLLGRGGSDLTAVFLAVALNAERCRLIKDVDGVYDADPAAAKMGRVRRFRDLSHEDALRVAGQLIQPKAVTFLKEHGRRVEIGRLARPYETRLHAGPSKLVEEFADEGAGGRGNAPPLPVVILGLGTVGYGVYQHLLAHPQDFRMVGVLVRNRQRYEAMGIPGEVLFTRELYVRRLTPAIVVDALPGIEPSARLLGHFLEAGASVVSANKAVIAERGVQLAALAAKRGGLLRYSASVGGSVPMLEAVERGQEDGAIRSVAAVLNGTCNFVLDRCGEGLSLEDAVVESKLEGFSESDPTDDLTGRDSERKLRILGRHAFGMELDDIAVQGLTPEVAQTARKALKSGMRLRQVARIERRERTITATIYLEHVPQSSLLGSIRREWNALEITFEDGSTSHVVGRGAGCWPTAESLIADAFDLWRRQVQRGCVSAGQMLGVSKVKLAPIR